MILVPYILNASYPRNWESFCFNKYATSTRAGKKKIKTSHKSQAVAIYQNYIIGTPLFANCFLPPHFNLTGH